VVRATPRPFGESDVDRHVPVFLTGVRDEKVEISATRSGEPGPL
jgi:hypothetical protein